MAAMTKEPVKKTREHFRRQRAYLQFPIKYPQIRKRYFHHRKKLKRNRNQTFKHRSGEFFTKTMHLRIWCHRIQHTPATFHTADLLCQIQSLHIKTNERRLNQEDIKKLIYKWNKFLYQLPPYHEAVKTVRLLKEKLLQSLFHTTQADPCILSLEDKQLEELLRENKLDVLPEIKYPTINLHNSIREFSDKHISFEKIVHVICDLLGIDAKLRDHFKKVDKEFQYHYTYKIWLEKFFEDNYNELIEKYNEQELNESLVTCLNKIGYTEEKSNIITDLIPQDLRQLHSPYFWALRYLENSFYHDSLLLYIPKFPFQPDKVNEWFEQYCDYDDDDNSCNLVKMINLTSDEAELRKVRPLLDDSGDFVFLYHGTSYQSCLSLIRDGIELSRGSANQDFSSLDGFYLSEDLEDAKRWGSAGRGDSYAVLVYKVRRDFVDAEKVYGLDLTTNFEQWKQVVKHCRSDYEIELDASVQLENVSYIRGPRTSGQAFLDGHLGRDFQAGNFIQVCIRDGEYAKLFGKSENVFRALFY